MVSIKCQRKPSRTADAVLGKHSVVGLGIDVVTRCGNQIETPAVAPAVRRTLEPADKEASEQGADAGNMRHGELGSTRLDRRMQSALVASSAVTADDCGDLSGIALHTMASETGAALGFL
jgi:hypothetical protein